MKVQVNGEERELDRGTTVASLVSGLGLGSKRIAIELNRDVIERASWPATVLRESDQVEIVQFVGGG